MASFRWKASSSLSQWAQEPGHEGETVQVFRIVSPRWASSALSGEGARLYGGRWNSPGRPMVYLASSRALAALELLVHLPTAQSRRMIYRILTIEIPIVFIGRALHQSPGWRKEPPPAVSRQQGDDWLQSESRTPCICAPSAIVPEEENILLNPHHSDAKHIRILGESDFAFDSRLLRKEAE